MPYYQAVPVLRVRFTFLSLCLVLFTSFTHASSTSGSVQSLSEFLHKAESMKLWQQKHWHALMHYHPVNFASGGYRSYVDDDAFFYSDKGDVNAKEELLATIKAMFSREDTGNEHAQCRFVSRIAWIVEQLGASKKDLPKVACVDYEQWRDQVNAHSVSLVFPASALNSPSSMFGHTLLRFDPEDVKQGTDWLSYALNFGANIDGGDNSIFFAYRGIAGGYPGVYNMMRYFEKIKEYNRMENRDMWEYQLDFTPEEVNIMLQHVWELKDINFDYYFIDENCAFRLLELMELVRPELTLTSQFELSAIPNNTVRAVVESGIVSDIDYRPSEVTLLRTRIDSMTEQQVMMSAQLSQDISILKSDEFKALSESEKGQIVQLSYSYLRYIQRKEQRTPEMAKRSHQLLLALNKLTVDEVEVTRPSSPEVGHETMLSSFLLGNLGDENYQQLQLRLSYHDLLDDVKGYPKGAQIIFANTELRNYEDQGLQLHRFDVIDIFSLSPRNELLKPLSWRVQVGYQRVQIDDGEQEGVLQLNGGAGHSYSLLDDFTGYGLLTSRLEYNETFDLPIDIAFGGEAGLLHHGSYGTGHLKLSGYKFTEGEYRNQLTFEQNFPIGVNHAIRVGASQYWQSRDNASEVQLSYRYYFR